MRLGWTLSGAGHLALMLVVLFGGLFAGQRIPDPIVASEVSIYTEEEFAALSRPESAPATQSDAPQVASPDPAQTAPEAPAPETAPEVSTPDPVAPAARPDSPAFEVEPPVPQALVEENAPNEPVAPSEFDGTTATPDQLAAPAPRVAPIPQVAPPPELETGPELIENTAPDREAPLPEPPEEAPAQAPDAASDRIVTEAEEEENYAPASSRRPRARPARPVRQAETPRESPATNAAVAAALGEETPTRPRGTGQRLAASETALIRDTVASCWNVGSFSTEALATKITIYVEMDRSGMPIMESFRLESFEGGSRSAANKVYRAARSALFRCGQRGLPLPPEKYEDWRALEFVFNPQGMQFR